MNEPVDNQKDRKEDSHECMPSLTRRLATNGLMAPVRAIADMVADPRRRSTRIVTRLERLRHPSQPGRTWSDHLERVNGFTTQRAIW